MPETMLTKLSEEDKELLGKCLRAFDLNKLLGSLYEFIETSGRYCDDSEPSKP